MDDIIQRVFSVLISVLILFILPLYITFEKMDDISYSLALKITSNFVDTVTAKGYITEEMYNDFVRELSVTGNVYDIKMEHIQKKYNPVYYIYDDENKNIISTLDVSLYQHTLTEDENNSNNIIFGPVGETVAFSKDKVKLSYKLSEVKVSEDQIFKTFEGTQDVPYSKMSVDEYKSTVSADNVSVIPYMYANYKYETDIEGNTIAQVDNDNRIYTMNKGDEFSVRIKNENTSIASVLFNAFTLGAGSSESNTRVYINYGGTVAEEEYMNLDKIIY